MDDIAYKIDAATYEDRILPRLSKDDKALFDRIYTKNDDVGIYEIIGSLSSKTYNKLRNIQLDLKILMPQYHPTEPMRMNERITVERFGELVGVWLRSYLNYLVSEEDLPEKEANIAYFKAYPDIVVSDFNRELKLQGQDGTILTNGEETDTPHAKFGNIITWKVVKHEVASIDPQPFTGRRPKKPTIIETVYDEQTSTSSTYATLRWDNLIQFDCFAKSDEEASLLRQNLETLLMVYGAEMGAWGLSIPPLHAGWYEDSELQGKLRVLKAASVRFYVRTETKFIKKDEAIEFIRLAVRHTQ